MNDCQVIGKFVFNFKSHLYKLEALLNISIVTTDHINVFYLKTGLQMYAL